MLAVKQFTELNKTLGKLEGAIKNGQSRDIEEMTQNEDKQNTKPKTEICLYKKL